MTKLEQLEKRRDEIMTALDQIFVLYQTAARPYNQELAEVEDALRGKKQPRTRRSRTPEGFA